MKFRTRTALASAIVAVVAFGSVATASAFGIDPYGADQPGQQPPVPATRTNGSSAPVHKELVTVTPCRVSDTRANGGAKLAPGNPRLINLTSGGAYAAQGGKPGGCAIPPSASAVVVSITSTQASGGGYLRAWAYGGAEPSATVLNYTALGNSGITTGATVPINGGLDVKAFGSSTHLVVDVTGYYVEPVAALVSSGGNLGSHSKTVTSAQRNGLGAYTLTFSQDLTGCIAQATAETSFYSAGAQILGTSAAVYTRNVTAGGAYGDTAFAVTITC